MLANSENTSNYIVFNSHTYVYEGADLKGFDKVTRGDVKLTGIDLTDNPYKQLISANSSDSSNSTGSAETATTSTTSDSKMKLGESSFSWGGYFQAIGILFLLLGLLCVALWIMRKYGKFSFIPNPSALPKNALCLEAQISLGPRKCLSVVRYLDKRLLLGVTDQRITLLSESRVNSDRDDPEFSEIYSEEQKHDRV